MGEPGRCRPGRNASLGAGLRSARIRLRQPLSQPGGEVFDLPKVIDFSKDFLPSKKIEWLAGDFFLDPLPEADLYAVGRILHDWSEDKIRALLEKICQRLPAGGGLLIAEKLLDEDQTGPLPALLQSLNMLVCTEGRERTLGEYEALLREAGFAQVHGRRTGAPLDAVLAVKGTVSQ